MHFSHFETATLHHNPALTGLFNGDIRFATHHKTQWIPVVPYMALSASAESKLLEGKIKKGVLAGGLVLNYDKAGKSELSNMQINASLAYAVQLHSTLFLSAGFQAGMGQRSFNFTNLSFDNQYNGDIYDPNRSTGEQFSKTNIIYPDVSGGVNLFYRKSDRFYFNIGTALYHVNTPNYSFLEDDEVKLPHRLVHYITGVFKVHSRWDLMPALLYQEQGTLEELASEFVIGVNARFYFNTQPSKEMALRIGAFNRLNDAFIVKLGAEFRDFQLGLSYDINTSPFVAATQRRGGPEVALVYTIKKVKSPQNVKICPVF